MNNKQASIIAILMTTAYIWFSLWVINEVIEQAFG
jgi:hypothetical protein